MLKQITDCLCKFVIAKLGDLADILRNKLFNSLNSNSFGRNCVREELSCSINLS